METIFDYNTDNETYLYAIKLDLKNAKYAKLKNGLRGRIIKHEIKNNQTFLTLDLQFNLEDFIYKGNEIHDLSVIAKPLKLIVDTETWIGPFDVFLYDKPKNFNTDELYKDIIYDLNVHGKFSSYQVQ